jgi:HSP20 family molecular chaperone IbpA
MAKRPASVLDFERAFDEFFDEMLISRWRRVRMPDEFENAKVLDHPDHYEVRIFAPNLDPEQTEIDVAGQHLSVRAPVGHEGMFETAYSFAAPIEAEAVKAHWSGHTLVITVPKQKPKRIKVNG